MNGFYLQARIRVVVFHFQMEPQEIGPSEFIDKFLHPQLVFQLIIFTITDIPIVVRNMNDPYVVAADLTGSTFQLITSYNVADNKRIIGFGLVGLGLLLAILAGIIYIITNAKKKSEKKGESLLKTENLDD